MVLAVQVVRLVRRVHPDKRVLMVRLALPVLPVQLALPVLPVLLAQLAQLVQQELPDPPVHKEHPVLPDLAELLVYRAQPALLVLSPKWTPMATTTA